MTRVVAAAGAAAVRVRCGAKLPRAAARPSAASLAAGGRCSRSSWAHSGRRGRRQELRLRAQSSSGESGPAAGPVDAAAAAGPGCTPLPPPPRPLAQGSVPRKAPGALELLTSSELRYALVSLPVCYFGYTPLVQLYSFVLHGNTIDDSLLGYAATCVGFWYSAVSANIYYFLCEQTETLIAALVTEAAALDRLLQTAGVALPPRDAAAAATHVRAHISCSGWHPRGVDAASLLAASMTDPNAAMGRLQLLAMQGAAAAADGELYGVAAVAAEAMPGVADAAQAAATARLAASQPKLAPVQFLLSQLLAVLIVVIFPLLHPSSADPTSEVEAALFAALGSVLAMFTAVVYDLADPWSGLCSVGDVRDKLLAGLEAKAAALEAAAATLAAEPVDLLAPGQRTRARTRRPPPPPPGPPGARTFVYTPGTGQLRQASGDV